MSIQCDTPVTYLPRARLANPIPELHLPHPRVYLEVNKVAQETAEREAKLLLSCNLDAAEMSDDCNTSSVTSDESGRSPHGLVNEVSQCNDVMVVGDAPGVVNKQAVNQEATNFDCDAHVNCGDNESESSYSQTVCFQNYSIPV